MIDAAIGAVVKKDVRRGESGVSAKIHFHRGRHPAQIEVFASRNDEGRLGQIVFRRDRLQRASSSHSSSRQTPAGLPPKGLLVKAAISK